ncbi:hypothetical protein B0O99DRAFT_679851 [Bisporella sp. PMI_857]|nr:hypothetical protein B0O99DRAFT_679851 [Bisporella sp. PMI_857]
MTEVYLGPWVRLEGIGIGQLPPGGRGLKPANQPLSAEESSDGSSSAAAPDLKTFITKVLSEAVPFIDGVSPKDSSASKWKLKGSPKTFPNSEAPVQIYERTVEGKVLDKIEGMGKYSADRRDEIWFCRKSTHRNKAETKTANWEEFVHAFKEHHAESEDAFTPAVIGAREAIRWDTNGLKIDVGEERWINTAAVVVEMKHKITPKPLKNRIFPVLQVAAELTGTQEVLIVSIPLNDFQKSPYAEYARDKSLVVASYVSIERIRVLPRNGEIEWLMGTASDAGGVLPPWIQNLAIPSQIAKDVDMFLAWIPSQRSGNTKATTNKKLPATPPDDVPPPISKTDAT